MQAARAGIGRFVRFRAGLEVGTRLFASDAGKQKLVVLGAGWAGMGLVVIVVNLA